MKNKTLYRLPGISLALLLVTSALSGGEKGSPIIPPSGSPIFSVPTDSGNGDANPYGVAFVPNGFPPGGPLRAGDVLVSNFNSNSGPPRDRHHDRANQAEWRPSILVLRGDATAGADDSVGCFEGRIRDRRQLANHRWYV